MTEWKASLLRCLDMIREDIEAADEEMTMVAVTCRISDLKLPLAQAASEWSERDPLTVYTDLGALSDFTTTFLALATWRISNKVAVNPAPPSEAIKGGRGNA